MKKVFIIRHAKSDQRFFGSDFERPLNQRGKTDAPAMAARLKEREPVVDAFVSSPAWRARETAENFISVFGGAASDIIFIPSLYHAPANVFFEQISQLPDTLNAVALFSHNPGITHFVNELTDTVHIDNMPTCGVFAVCVHTDKWVDFDAAKKEFLFIDYPKLH